MTVDLSLLPAPAVIQPLDVEAIIADMKADLVSRFKPEEQAAMAALLQIESEPMVKLMQVFAYRELLLRARYNDEARALLLAYATEDELDHIGVTYYQESRLTITPGNPAAVPPVPPVIESDDDYRYRLSLKPESYSVAGPRDAFLFHARSADGHVKAASVTSPNPGSTRVYILSRTGNGTPAPALLATVAAALSAETVRPLSEDVQVAAGVVVEYAIDVALTLFPGPVGEVVLQAVNAALASFVSGRHTLGADIILSAIHAAAHQAGVKKVDIVSPAADIVCDDAHAPYCTAITVTVARVEP